MDPNANLKEQRELVQAMLERQDGYDDTMPPEDIATYHQEQADDAERLAELVQALDEWLVGGGFLPQDWRRP